MTTITVPRAVLEQALAAMDKATRFMSDSDYVKLNQAIDALRTALAQQEQDWQDLYRKEKARADMWRDKYESMAGPDDRVYTQQEQEPVAWMYVGIKQDGTTHGPHLVWKPQYMDAMSAEKGAKATPLYTAPPRREWRGLTEEEIADAQDAAAIHFRESRHGVRGQQLMPSDSPDWWLARAIEQALKEKNNG